MTSRPPAVFWEVLAASVVLVWRVLRSPLAEAWSDWVVILSVYWIFTALASETKAWRLVTVATMLVLFALYASIQIPLALEVLRVVL